MKGKTYTCLVQDDNYMFCLAVYDKRQHTQDGMCAACAEKMWEWVTSGTSIIHDKPEEE